MARYIDSPAPTHDDSAAVEANRLGEDNERLRNALKSVLFIAEHGEPVEGETWKVVTKTIAEIAQDALHKPDLSRNEV